MAPANSGCAAGAATCSLCRKVGSFSAGSFACPYGQTASAGVCVASVLNDLYHFYASTNGAAWYNNIGWASVMNNAPYINSTAADWCTWNGITCDVSSVITAISLSANNLVGSLDTLQSGTFAFFGTLTGLKTLQLSGNQLSGSFKLDFGANWASFETLDLSANKLSGAFPLNSFANETVGSAWTGLKTFRLTGNQLSGEIPTSLGAKWGASMLTFQLNNNALSGAIPSPFGAAWTALTTFSVANNALTGSFANDFGSTWNALAQLGLMPNSFDYTTAFGSPLWTTAKPVASLTSGASMLKLICGCPAAFTGGNCTSSPLLPTWMTAQITTCYGALTTAVVNNTGNTPGDQALLAWETLVANAVPVLGTIVFNVPASTGMTVNAAPALDSNGLQVVAAGVTGPYNGTYALSVNTTAGTITITLSTGPGILAAQSIRVKFTSFAKNPLRSGAISGLSISMYGPTGALLNYGALPAYTVTGPYLPATTYTAVLSSSNLKAVCQVPTLLCGAGFTLKITNTSGTVVNQSLSYDWALTGDATCSTGAATAQTSDSSASLTLSGGGSNALAVSFNVSITGCQLTVATASSCVGQYSFAPCKPAPFVVPALSATTPPYPVSDYCSCVCPGSGTVAGVNSGLKPAPGNYLMGFTAQSGCSAASCIPACQQAFPAQCGGFTPTAPAIQACTANPTLATKSTPPAPVPFSAAASLMTVRGAARAAAAVLVAVAAQLAAF